MEHPQRLLMVEPEVLDLIEKNRALMGQFEEALPVGEGAGRAASDPNSSLSKSSVK
ncbi:MAG: hypothetical protein U0231_10505 [Nitrospiraceae bacterium]